MKNQAKILDGTPSKRLFYSIISDYNLNTAVCELIDNALDIWIKGGKQDVLRVEIDLDAERQLIRIQDSAGGVPEEDLSVLISPGASRNDPEESIIGIFGVGTKRAVVALAQDVKILSRHKNGRTFQIDIDENWLGSSSWDLPAYEIDEIRENTTIVDLSKLRIIIRATDEATLSKHLSETYAYFLRGGNVDILINNGPKIEPTMFDNWAYPPDFGPRCFVFELPTEDRYSVGVEITAGLIRKQEEAKDDYGVYFYCNERLIRKEMRERELGYITGQAGIPHSDASLARTIVKLYGPAKLMPWNSSKSAINFGHHVFRGLQSFVIPVVSDYSSLSRRLRGDWEEAVFKYTDGEIEYVDVKEVAKVRKSYLPTLPRVKKSRAEHLKAKNAATLRDQPWTLGLIEAMAAVEIIRRQKLDTKNRIALILLDSNFEIALKEYIVHAPSLSLGGKTLDQIFTKRDNVISIVTSTVPIDAATLSKVKHYYGLRNKLIHEKATVDVTETDIDNYLETVERVLSLLFGLTF